MTEDDAKQKWCPFTHVIIGPDNGSWQNQMFDSRGEHMNTERRANCLGSGCAAWVSTDNEFRPRPEWGATADNGLPAGFCGLTRRDQ